MDIIKIINEEIDVFEYEERRRRERDPNRQPRVGRDFKRGDSTFAKSRKSNPEVRGMREKITKYVYEARSLIRKHFGVTPPRVTYRVVDWTPEEIINNDYAGCAFMGGNVILVPGSSFDQYDDLRIKHIVYHELLHAVYCLDHDEKSKLMNSALPQIPLTDKELDKWYVKHVKESGRSDLSDVGYNKQNR